MHFYYLLQNEHMKLYRRLGNWLYFALILVGLIFSAVNYLNQEELGDDWKEVLAQSNAEMKQTLAKENAPYLKNVLTEKIAINEYRIQHNLKPYLANLFFKDTENSLGIVNICTLVVASAIVASEFSWGTIKLLVIRPFKRYKLLLAKYITVILFSILMLTVLTVSYFLAGGILFGWEGLLQNVLLYQDGLVVEKPILLYIVQNYGFNLVQLIMLATLAFMISSIFRNQSIAISVAFLSMMLGANVTFLLAQKYEWAKYILFANIDLTQYFNGTPMVKGMTLSFSITMLVIYYLAFVGLTWYFFQKRDIAG